MPTNSLVLDFKSATLYAVRLVLHSADSKKLMATLAKRLADANQFFQNEPVIIDALHVNELIDWHALLAALRTYSLPPLGIAATGENLRVAQTLGLTPLELPTQQKALPSTASTASTAPTPAASSPPAATPSLVINKPLRSGQHVYARHTDLIVVGMVSPGAEVIADGNVHVYGPLRGKAMAGAQGDTSARIFTTHFDAELLAIAGVYQVVESKPHASLHGQAALVRLEEETLYIEALKA